MSTTSVFSRLSWVVNRFLAVAAATILIFATGCGKDEPEKSQVARPRLHVVEYGRPIFFGLGGDSDRFRLLGWSATEAGFTWTDGIGASIAMRPPASEHPVRLNVKAAGMNTPGRLPFQPVEVTANGEKIATWEVAEQKVYSAIIPQKFFRVADELLFIDFYMPKATSPASLGQGGDLRRLGIQVVDVQLEKAPEAAAQNSPQP